jgi:hypothetical protein
LEASTVKHETPNKPKKKVVIGSTVNGVIDRSSSIGHSLVVKKKVYVAETFSEKLAHHQV